MTEKKTCYQSYKYFSLKLKMFPSTFFSITLLITSAFKGFKIIKIITVSIRTVAKKVEEISEQFLFVHPVYH